MTTATTPTTSITFDAKELTEAVNWVAKGVARTAPTVEYEAIFLNLVGTSLKMSAFDGADHFSSAIDVTRDLDDNSTLKLAVFGPLLQQVAKTLRSGKADMEISANNIIIKTGRSRMTLPLLRIKRLEPPAVPSKVGTVPAGALKSAVAQVSVAASTDETLASLTAVLFEFYPEDSILRLVACDRFRLAIKDIEYDVQDGAIAQAEKKGDPSLRIVVPAKAIKKLIAGLSSDGIVGLHGSASGNSFFGLSSLVASGAVGTFGDDFVKYKALMGLSFPNRITFDKAEMKAAVADIVSVSGNSATVGVDVHEGGITVHHISEDSSIEVDAVPPEGVEVSFEFASEYLLAALNTSESPTISWEFGPANKPVITRNALSGDRDDKTWFHLFMPVTQIRK